MKNEKEWETKSLEWIHKVREEIDEEIRREGVTLSQWIKSKGEVDTRLLCQKLGLKNFTIVEDKVKKEKIG